MIRRHLRALLFAAVALGGAFTVHRVAASQGARSRRARVEHCAVVVTSGHAEADGRMVGHALLCRFGSADSRCENLRYPQRGQNDPSWDAIRMQTASSVISMLGSEGWELVGEGRAAVFGGGSDAPALYFKRVVE